jgi:hypothetical protein
MDKSHFETKEGTDLASNSQCVINRNKHENENIIGIACLQERHQQVRGEDYVCSSIKYQCINFGYGARACSSSRHDAPVSTEPLLSR